MSKGLWQPAGRGEVEVAVKTLNEGSDEEDRVKFLQEAAIMGQFKHPNVVEMYGMVIRDMPVSIFCKIVRKRLSLDPIHSSDAYSTRASL